MTTNRNARVSRDERRLTPRATLGWERQRY